MLRLDRKTCPTTSGSTGCTRADRAGAENAIDDVIDNAIDDAETAEDPPDQVEQVVALVDQLYEQDLAVYQAAYEQPVRAELAERGVTVPIRLHRRTTLADPDDAVSDENSMIL